MLLSDDSRLQIEKGYEKLLFHPRPLQVRELDNLQDFFAAQLTRFGEVVCRDGDLIAGEITVQAGEMVISPARVYLDGRVRALPGCRLKKPEHEVKIGVRVSYTCVTTAEDASLAEPLQEGTNFNNPGADRRRSTLQVEAFAEQLPPAWHQLAVVTAAGQVFISRPASLAELSACRAYERVLDLRRDALDFSSFLPGSRIFITGGEVILTKEVVITADDLSLTFANGVRLWLPEDLSDEGAAFVVTGKNLRVTGITAGWKKPQRKKVEGAYFFTGKEADEVYLSGHTSWNFSERMRWIKGDLGSNQGRIMEKE